MNFIILSLQFQLSGRQFLRESGHNVYDKNASPWELFNLLTISFIKICLKIYARVNIFLKAQVFNYFEV